jgi:hypothetical protein
VNNPSKLENGPRRPTLALSPDSFQQASRDRETSCSRLQFRVIVMPGTPASPSPFAQGEDEATPQSTNPTEQAPKRPENTVAGCQAFADSDLKDAAHAPSRSSRLELEKSAAGWTERAGLLQRIANSFRKRAALDEAERERARDRLITR